MATTAHPPTGAYHQETIDPLLEDPKAALLSTTTFVVVDLETTGGSPDSAGITEIGAVKVRGGEVLGEFSTLVNPGQPIPPFITVLTGITQAMVAPAPPVATVLPMFCEFAAGAVLVAHNAPFDIGFLRAACARHDIPWPRPLVLDTVALARRALLAGEVPNRKLATLAQYLKTAHQPNHRALDDARTTADLLHALIGRLGSRRVHTLGEALDFLKGVSEVQQRRRHLADGLPAEPGVYLFRGHDGQPLYIGTSSCISTRVRSYFTAAEKRARMDEMLTLAERIEAVVCSHALEAEVRELRLIAAHKPPYNRRSKYPERSVWLKLAAGPYPRLSVVTRVNDDAAYLGPFGSRHAAALATDGIHDALRMRQCSQRLSTRRTSPACALAELGRCDAPCQHGISVDEYAERVVEPFRAVAHRGDPSAIVHALQGRIRTLSEDQRYEDASVVRDRLAAFLRAAIRMQRLASFTGLEQVVAAHPAPQGGWEIAVVRHGRLASATRTPPGHHPAAGIEAALATAETVRPGRGPTPCAAAEETERILSWLERPETRLVDVAGRWCSPTASAARWRQVLAQSETARA